MEATPIKAFMIIAAIIVFILILLFLGWLAWNWIKGIGKHDPEDHKKDDFMKSIDEKDK